MSNKKPCQLLSMLPATTGLAALVLALLPSATAQASDKKGLIYIATDHESDYRVFDAEGSPLSWYYNYSPWPSLPDWDVPFAPMVHGADDAASSVQTIQSLVNGTVPHGRNTVSHVLVFNEPDGDTGSGGSDNSPAHAAQVYFDDIAPLRGDPFNLRLSVPATTGSPRGLEWLRDFNASCFDIDEERGCEFDFVAAHWYGDFAGLASWVGTLHDLYPDLPMWVTEFAVAGLDADETAAMMNESLPFLEGLEYVERYAWFGAFRDDDANEWTGDGVSLLNGDGGLTELGAQYMGEGYDAGDSTSGEGGAGMVRCSASLVAAALAGTLGVVVMGLW